MSPHVSSLPSFAGIHTCVSHSPLEVRDQRASATATRNSTLGVQGLGCVSFACWHQGLRANSAARAPARIIGRQHECAALLTQRLRLHCISAARRLTRHPKPNPRPRCSSSLLPLFNGLLFPFCSCYRMCLDDAPTLSWGFPSPCIIKPKP